MNARNDAAVFVTTRWSVVISAGSGTKSAEEALSQLCGAYWYPLYAFVRRQGHSPHDAEDLTQGFFTYLLEKQTLERVQRDKGKFRSFLLACLTNFLANEWDKRRAAKRGGGRVIISLDDDSAEARYAQEATDGRTPETIYERIWAATVLRRALSLLSEQYSASGKEELFWILKPHLMDEADEKDSYSELGQQLGMKEGSVRMAMLRMRQHFTFLLQQEIAETVTDPSEIEGELRYLIAAAAR
jgi:RNA polymerase sigma-70 factor (ECF subfamily)